MEKTRRKKQIFEKIIDVFAWLCLFVAVILSIITFAASISGEQNGKEIFGHKLLIVNTDSMSKSVLSEDEKIFFEAGDLIIIKKVSNVSALKEGEVITFFSYNPESLGKTVTHKIRQIKRTETGEVTGIVTYGINTGVNDMVEVKPEYVMGKYAYKIPKIGKLFSFLKTPRGFYLSILIPGVLLIIFFSVKVGKVLGRQEYARAYNGEMDELKERITSLEENGGEPTALKRDAKITTQNETAITTLQCTANMEDYMENNEQLMEELATTTVDETQESVTIEKAEESAPVEETPAPKSEEKTEAPANNGQGAVYQTVSINYQPSPFTPAPVIYQTAPSSAGPVYQTITIAPAPVQPVAMGCPYQPVFYQPVQPACPYQPVQAPTPLVAYPPYQSAPVIYQTASDNAPVPPAPVAQPTTFAPTQGATISQNASQTAQAVNQTITGAPMPVYYPVTPVAPQPAPVVEQPKQEDKPEPAPVVESKPEVEPEPTPEEEIAVTQETLVEQTPVEPLDEVLDEEEAIEEVTEETEGGLNIPAGNKKPFSEKLIEAKEETQKYFNAVHNELVSYKRVNSRVSRRGMSYRAGRTLIAKIGLRGKTLTGYFNLDLNAFNEKTFFQKDMSATKAYEEVPFAVKIKSERACNNATKLVTAVAEKFELKKNPKFEEVNAIEEFKKND